MEENLDALRTRLLEEVKYSTYPSERSAIRDRYTDTAYFIFKTSQTGHRASLLSYGSRRSSLVSSYGNTPTIIRRSFSSNGMFEYAEQIGTMKYKDSHVLPSITKEEKEIDEQEEISHVYKPSKKQGSEVEFMKEHKNNPKAKSSDEKINSHNQKEVSLSQDENTLVEEEEEEDLELNSKNRKIFLHYDMPPIRKPSLPNKHSMDIVKVSKSNTSVNVGGADNKDETDTVHTEKLNFKETPQPGNMNMKLVTSSTSSQSDPAPTVNEKAEVPVLPKISLAAVSESSGELIVGSSNESSAARDDIVKERTEAFSLPLTQEASYLERTTSVNEKNMNPFPRKNVSRLSLRDLPLRSPTPPKKSPRKATKNFKDKENVRLNASSFPEEIDSPSVSSLSSSTTFNTVTNSLPPLISSKSESNENGVHQAGHSPLSLVDSKPFSTQSLDDTPLFIVEDHEKPSVSPRVGIHSLATDGKLSKSFIVVHPTSDSNSLGLAPLSSYRKKSTTESSTHSSSTSLQLVNGRKSSFSRSLQKTSLNKPKTKKLNDNSPSYLSTNTTNSSQVRLLKFSKSFDEGNFVSSISPTKTNPILTTHQVTKGRIRSYPLEKSCENEFNLDFSGNFVNTNSSRLCIVM